jgi:hypothetical protein
VRGERCVNGITPSAFTPFDGPKATGAPIAVGGAGEAAFVVSSGHGRRWGHFDLSPGSVPKHQRCGALPDLVCRNGLVKRFRALRRSCRTHGALLGKEVLDALSGGNKNPRFSGGFRALSRSRTGDRLLTMFRASGTRPMNSACQSAFPATRLVLLPAAPSLEGP